MEALRKIVEINNNVLKFNIPVNFKSKYVEIIILPFHKKDVSKEKDDLSEFQKFLLSAPVMQEEDFQYYNEKKQHFNQWK